MARRPAQQPPPGPPPDEAETPDPDALRRSAGRRAMFWTHLFPYVALFGIGTLLLLWVNRRVPGMPLGALQWERNFGTSYYTEEARSAIQTADGGYALTGRADGRCQTGRTTPYNQNIRFRNNWNIFGNLRNLLHTILTPIPLEVTLLYAFSRMTQRSPI